jgi:hypothetical protein
MIMAGAAALLLYAFAAEVEQPRPQPAPPVPQGLAGVRQQVIVRVTTGMRIAPAQQRGARELVEWRESRGPRCIPLTRILGATFPSQNSVDLIMRDRTRMRARLERRCAALDFYRSFYLSMTPDGLVCADRDSIRSRSGGECQIDQFRSLMARPAR